MTEAYVLTLAQSALTTTLILAAPILVVSLVIGILVSIFQSATQINEVTMTFIPKIIGIGVVVALLGSWMAQQLLAFTTNLFTSISTLPH